MVQIQFELPLQGKISPVYGPYEYVQLTYNAVRVGPEGERELAFYNQNGLWVTDDGSLWTDMTVTQA